MSERKYRSYTEEFKLEALALLEKQDKSAGQIERELGITPGMLLKLMAECATQPFTSRAQARTAIFEYIEARYNRVRLHSSLDYLSPLEFEQSGH